MMADSPPQIAAAGQVSAQSITLPEGGVQLPAGEILSGVVQAPPPGSPAGAVLLALDNFPAALIRASFPLLPGERLAVEAEGEGSKQTLRLGT